MGTMAYGSTEAATTSFYRKNAEFPSRVRCIRHPQARSRIISLLDWQSKIENSPQACLISSRTRMKVPQLPPHHTVTATASHQNDISVDISVPQSPKYRSRLLGCSITSTPGPQISCNARCGDLDDRTFLIVEPSETPSNNHFRPEYAGIGELGRASQIASGLIRGQFVLTEEFFEKVPFKKSGSVSVHGLTLN